jgi:hypothetical protein
MSGLVSISDTREYELLTDTAAIFLGMGKLILAGSGGVGYPSKPDAAFAYLLVSEMRGIPEHVYKFGLDLEDVKLLAEVRQQHASYLKRDLHSVSQDRTSVPGIASQIDEVQRMLAEFESLAMRVSAVVDWKAHDLSSEIHEKIAALQHTADTFAGIVDHDPCMRYLRNVEAEIAIREQADTVASDLAKVQRAYDDVAAIYRFIDEECPSLPIALGDEVDTTRCRRCGTALRVGPRLDLKKVRCPKCQYMFYAKTARPKATRKRLFPALFKR